ncbi:hypothetical protein T11_10910 [Trichinella zimbabwensis]|uniref:Uncharacterized protein n=1 Tax=Trichinella zimbabwensis TaxID=268475 RepID=A0A0V1GPU9_9BILA|nr:hypothetical protein T11_10910 [Trichinella zimbabwensis]
MQSFIRLLCVQIRGFSLNGCWRTVCGVSAVALDTRIGGEHSIAAYALNLQFLSGRSDKILLRFKVLRLT